MMRNFTRALIQWAALVPLGGLALFVLFLPLLFLAWVVGVGGVVLVWATVLYAIALFVVVPRLNRR